jgi:hypothetical protein
MGVKLAKLKKTFKNYWLWKLTFGAYQQEHLEDKRLEMK